SLAIVTGMPADPTAWVNRDAGRACSPTADATATVRSGMRSSLTWGAAGDVRGGPSPAAAVGLLRLDRDLDGLTPRDDADPVEHLVEREPVGDEVEHGHGAVRDEREGLLVVLRARAVRAHDRDLLVVDDVRVERDGGLVLGQPTEERDAALTGDHPERVFLRGAGSGRRDHDVGPPPARELADLRDGVLLARGDRGVRLDQVGGHVEA